MRLRELSPPIQEGADVTRGLIQQAFDDPGMTIGFEIEFQLHGVNRITAQTITADATKNAAGHYVKTLATLTYADFIKFFGPLRMSPDERTKTNQIVLRHRMVKLLGRNENPQRDFRLILERLGMVGFLVAIKAFPVVGFDTDEQTNLALAQAVINGDTNRLSGIEKLSYPLHYTTDKGEYDRISPEMIDEPVMGGPFSLEADHESRAAFLQVVAKSLGTKLGGPVAITADSTRNPEASNDYRKWLLTYDDTINSDSRKSAPIELISPVMHISQGIGALGRVFDLMKNFETVVPGTKAITHGSTGLHINIGVGPERLQHFDWVKLLFLVGEEHVLSQFGRRHNRMVEPIIPKLVAAMQGRGNPSGEVSQLLSDGRTAAAVSAVIAKAFERAIHKGRPMDEADKFVSMNMRKLFTEGYVEFRMVGNSGYEDRLEEIVRLIHRFAVLMRAASDPTLFQKEYFKKVYVFLSKVAVEPASRARQTA